MKYFVVVKDEDKVKAFENIEDFKKYIAEIPEESKLVAFQGEQFLFNKSRTKCRLLNSEYILAAKKDELFTEDFV